MESYLFSGIAVVFSAFAVWAAFRLMHKYIETGRANSLVDLSELKNAKAGTKEYVFASFATVTSALAGFSLAKGGQQFLSLLALLLCLSLLIIAAWLDFKLMIIPNFVPASIFVIRLLYFFYELIFQKNALFSLLNSLLAMTVIFLVFMISSKLSKKNIGGGDIKLMCALGFLLGLESTMELVLLALMSAILFSVILVTLKKRTMKDYIPFGPYIYLGYVLTCLIMF